MRTSMRDSQPFCCAGLAGGDQFERPARLQAEVCRGLCRGRDDAGRRQEADEQGLRILGVGFTGEAAQLPLGEEIHAEQRQ
jgi:hypothetical protein